MVADIVQEDDVIVAALDGGFFLRGVASLELLVHTDGRVRVVPVEEVDDVLDAEVDRHVAEEGAHGGQYGDIQVLHILVNAEPSLQELELVVGDVGGSDGKLGSQCEEDHHEDGFERANEVSEEAIAAVALEAVRLAVVGDVDGDLERLDAGEVGGTQSGDDGGDLAEARPEEGTAIGQVVQAGCDDDREGAKQNVHEVREEILGRADHARRPVVPLHGQLVETPVDEVIEVGPGGAP